VEPGVAGPQRILGIKPRGQHGAQDRLLLQLDAFAQLPGVSGGQRSLNGGDPVGIDTADNLARLAAQLAADQLDGPAQRLRGGEVPGHQLRTDVGGGLGAERFRTQRIEQRSGVPPE
jgi:hypothetical protein